METYPRAAVERAMAKKITRAQAGEIGLWKYTGIGGVVFKPRDATSYEGPVISSSKNIRLSAGTFVVVEVKKVQLPRKS